MSQLFSPIAFRDLTLPNRAVVAPMCQYSAVDGMPNDWHFVHLGRFAQGGFGLVIAEATAVTAEGRISYADTGLWKDDQIDPFRRIVDFLHSQGSAAGIQLAHAGRKAAAAAPWHGAGRATEADRHEPGFEDWQTVAPSAVAHSDKYDQPLELDEAGIDRLVEAFVAATHRSETAGFDVIELHLAHGYQLNEFLSPLANKRTDRYGGSRENRMRFPLRVVEAVRAAWPAAKPLFVRISAVDWHPEGWQLEDSVVLARELKARGVDLIHCTSGGFDGARVEATARYQVPLAQTVRHEAGIATMAVGLLTTATEAEAILAGGEADLVALARGALDDPNWAHHARHELDGGEDTYQAWPRQVGYAIRNKDRSLRQRAFGDAL